MGLGAYATAASSSNGAIVLGMSTQHGDGTVQLLRTLAKQGLRAEALPVAAALIMQMEHEALARAELAAAEVRGTGAYGRGTGAYGRCAYNLVGRELRRPNVRSGLIDEQELSMPATATATTDAAAPRQPKDPEAAALAAAARNLARAAGLKSGYTSGEGREVLNRFTVEKARGVLVITKNDGEPQRVKLAVLRAFLAGEKTADTRQTAKLMAELARDLKGMLYGRKLAAFLIAHAA